MIGTRIVIVITALFAAVLWTLLASEILRERAQRGVLLEALERSADGKSSSPSRAGATAVVEGHVVGRPAERGFVAGVVERYDGEWYHWVSDISPRFGVKLADRSLVELAWPTSKVDGATRSIEGSSLTRWTGVTTGDPMCCVVHSWFKPLRKPLRFGCFAGTCSGFRVFTERERAMSWVLLGGLSLLTNALGWLLVRVWLRPRAPFGRNPTT